MRPDRSGRKRKVCISSAQATGSKAWMCCRREAGESRRRQGRSGDSGGNDDGVENSNVDEDSE